VLAHGQPAGAAQAERGRAYVVGTPGRLRDHIERGGLPTTSLQVVVLDEADEMLDLGFREDLEFILETTPKERRTLLFSATCPRASQSGKRYQRDALRVEVAGGARGHADIEYRVIRVAPRRSSTPSSICCASSRRDGDRVLQHPRGRAPFAGDTTGAGFSAVLLSGELSQHERNQSMQALRDGRAKVCVATDVAARGIDLPNLGLVIHAELPMTRRRCNIAAGARDARTARGSAPCCAPARHRRAEMLLRTRRSRALERAPTAEEIARLDQQRLLQDRS